MLALEHAFLCGTYRNASIPGLSIRLVSICVFCMTYKVLVKRLYVPEHSDRRPEFKDPAWGLLVIAHQWPCLEIKRDGILASYRTVPSMLNRRVGIAFTGHWKLLGRTFLSSYHPHKIPFCGFAKKHQHECIIPLSAVQAALRIIWHIGGQRRNL